MNTAAPRGGFSNTPLELTNSTQTPSTPEEPEQDFRIHWLAGSLDAYYIDVTDEQGTKKVAEFNQHDLITLVRSVANTDLIEQPRGLNGYRRRLDGVGGIKVLLDPSTSNQPLAHLIVPGEACDALGLEALQQLACVLRLTRLDLAFDHCPFTPKQLLDEWLAGNTRTRIQKESYDWRSNAQGDSVYFGSKKASQQINCYDQRGFTRLELRLKGERADKSFEALLSEPNHLKETALGLLCNFFEFVDAQADSNISRCPRLDWWQLFIEGVERLKVLLEPRPQFDFERTKTWIKKNVAPSLVALLCAVGFDHLNQILNDGLDNLSPRLEAEIARARQKKMTKLGRKSLEQLAFQLSERKQLSKMLIQ